MIGQWLIGLVKTRSGRLLGTIAGIALTVALLSDLGLFLAQSSASLTARALRAVATDWQVELRPGYDAEGIVAAARSATAVTIVDPVTYADIDGFELSAAGSVQTTGGGKAVGIPSGYFDRHSSEVRVLAGDLSGGVLLQQTAANLHAVPGDTITIRRHARPDATIKITGVIDLRSADSFFQAIGVPTGTAPQAPPDNVVMMSAGEWSGLFAAQAAAQPDMVRTQLHFGINHTSLPPDPNDAYAVAAASGRNFEARVAGSASLSNNLAAQLDAVRGDALYAKVLFLFLGLPGGILAILLTLAVAYAGSQTRQRDQALLKVRGAPPALGTRYSAVEAMAVGAGGSVVGVGTGMAVALSIGGLSLDWSSLGWLSGCGLSGLALAGCAIFVPAFWSAKTQTFAASKSPPARRGTPLWQRLYIDIICLGLAALIFWKTAATGYQIVLATEGVTATAVDYTAFLSPVLLWIGSGLLTIRLSRALLLHGRSLIQKSVTAIAGSVAPAVASAMSQQRARIAVGVALTALAIAFLTSTSIFNATFEAQARVDAQLTNGADVTVMGTASSPAGAILNQLRRLPGVLSAEPMQHRYAYVGTDLQDLYGIDAAAIGKATNLSNAFFANGDATATLGMLASRPDAVLVSEETVTDFQLALGDAINLRLQSADGTFHIVPFTFAGVVREFPTAPHDSFLVANSAYVAKATGLDAAEIVLMRSSGDFAALKAVAQTLVEGRALAVSSLDDAVHIIGSSLSAVDLHGLTRIELAYGVLLAIGSTALFLALGFADRRRDFAILKVLGASHRILGSFVWAETGFILGAGIAVGAILGTLVAQILVKVLEGAFDPPPELMTVPWAFLGTSVGVILVATAFSARNAVRRGSEDILGRLRED